MSLESNPGGSERARADAVLLQTLAGRQAITDQIYRYCRAVDRIDPELGHGVFHDDGQADYGDVFVGSGRDAIDLICAQHRIATVHTHQVTNILTSLDGDRAGTEAYFVSALRIELDGVLTEIMTWGRYLDQWSKRDGRWAVDQRIVVRDLDQIGAARPMSVFDRGRRDADDPSYAVLGLK